MGLNVYVSEVRSQLENMSLALSGTISDASDYLVAVNQLISE